MKEKSYITTPIYYVNDVAHIGHAYTTIICDMLKKYRILNGIDTILTTGSDEHGQKIQQSAMKKGVAPQVYADEISAKFRDVWDKFDIDYDNFIRTTDKDHEKLVQYVFSKMLEKGDIYKGTYQGRYCVSCECFFTDLQVINEVYCPDCGKETSMVEEESYFFALSKYQDKLLDIYKNNPDFILPLHKRNEVVRFVEGGLNDLSITRTSFSWGVPLPSDIDKDKKHVVYVWLDALFSYLSALGITKRSDFASPKMEYFKNTTHVIGKDILRFHAIFWPAFLLSLDLPLPKHLYVHGWWTRDGVKMSKSIGNVVNPYDVVEKYGMDNFRYFLLREVSFGQDGDFSYKALTDRINSELSNDLGNLVSRLSGMSEKYFSNTLKDIAPQAYKAQCDEVENILASLPKMMEQMNLNRYLEELWKIYILCNALVAKYEPWNLMKGDMSDKKACENLLGFMANAILKSSFMLYPIMPSIASSIAKSYGVEINPSSYKKYILDKQYLSSIHITKLDALFPKVEYVPETKPETKIESKQEIEYINIEDFKKLDIRVGTIVLVERVKDAQRLYRLLIDIGEEEPRQVVSSIAEDFKEDELLNSQVCLLANLKPSKFRGVMSYGMILASNDKNTLGLLSPNRVVENGSKVN